MPIRISATNHILVPFSSSFPLRSPGDFRILYVSVFIHMHNDAVSPENIPVIIIRFY